VFQPPCTVGLRARTHQFSTLRTKTIMAEAREERMQAALAEIEHIIKPNYSAIAEKHNIHRTTLSRRHQLKTRDLHTFRSQSKQLLSDAEEEVLVNYLNTLATRGLFATTRILVNIVEERLGRQISHTWASGFIGRHSDVLKSVYLKGFDTTRFASESVANTQVFFDNVS
jgi:hypothetical protein